MTYDLGVVGGGGVGLAAAMDLIRIVTRKSP